MKEVKDLGIDPYPHNYNPDYNIIDLIKKNIPEFQYPPFLIIIFALILFGFSINFVTLFKLFFLFVKKYPY